MNIWKLKSNAILPLIYEESLSYGQQVALVRGKLNEVIKEVEKIQEILSGEDDTTQQIISTINKLINDVNVISAEFNQLENNVNQINTTLQTYMQNTNSSIQNITNSLTNLENALDVYNSQMRQDMAELYLQMSKLTTSLNTNFDILKQDLIEFIHEQEASHTGYTLLVMNPITQKISSLNVALKDLLKFMQRFAGLTIKEYASLNLTMQEYDDMHITLIDYDTHAKFIFFPRLLKIYFNDLLEEFELNIQTQLDELKNQSYVLTHLNNPFTAVIDDTLTNVLRDFLNRYLAGLNMSEYAALQLTMSEYENLKVNVIEYETEWIVKYILDQATKNNLFALTYVASSTRDLIYYTMQFYAENGEEIITIKFMTTLYQIFSAVAIQNENNLECQVGNYTLNITPKGYDPITLNLIMKRG